MDRVTFYNVAGMNGPQLDVTHLRRRDPLAWTMLLNSHPDMRDVVVTAVSARPLRDDSLRNQEQQLVRYVLTLTNHSDPITFIGKRTNQTEALFYRDFAAELPGIVPRCLFTRVGADDGWIILDDVPCDYAPQQWTAVDIEAITHTLADLHSTFWEREEDVAALPHFIGRQQKTYSWDELRQQEAIYFEEGPASILSEHAIKSAGRLAPVLLRAANGLAVISSLGGWPGILGESHLSAAADLLDDPLPMLQTLHDLPPTLLHGDPHNYRWHFTLFDEHRLLDWHKLAVGPGIYDLVKFVEQLDLIYRTQGHTPIYTRQQMPMSQETVIDNYILALKSKLGSHFDARTARQAIPAARCLYVLTHWFPHFADWFSQMPNKYTWQKINRMSDEQLMGTMFQPIVGFRPYLASVFQRFLQSYRTL